MTKKIERSRVEAGKVELPRKVGFLSTEKVDYLVVIDRDGELSIEVPAAVLSKLVKSRGELKTLKGAQKQAAAEHAAALAEAKDAHQATLTALSKAERRIKSLEKKRAAAAEEPAAPPPAAIEESAPKKGTQSVVSPKPASPMMTKAASASVDTAAAAFTGACAASKEAAPDMSGVETASAVAVVPPATTDPVAPSQGA